MRNNLVLKSGIAILLLISPFVVNAQDAQNFEQPNSRIYASFSLVKNIGSKSKVGVNVSFEHHYKLSSKLDLKTSIEGGLRGVLGLNGFATSSLTTTANFYHNSGRNFYTGVGLGLHHMNAFCGVLCIDYEGPYYDNIPIKPALNFDMGYFFKSGTGIGLNLNLLPTASFSTTRPVSTRQVNASHVSIVFSFLMQKRR